MNVSLPRLNQNKMYGLTFRISLIIPMKSDYCIGRVARSKFRRLNEV